MTRKKYEVSEDWILEEMLKVAMEDECSDHEKYRRLSEMANKTQDRKLLSEISEDEKRHRKVLQYLYHTLFGKDHHCSRGHGERLGGFRESVGKSVVNEYSGISFYREILNRIPDERVRMPIRRIMADEQRHAQILEGMLEYR